MSRVVRIKVHDDETCFAPVDDKMFFIVVFSREVAEYAPVLGGLGRFDIRHPPRRVKLLHFNFLSLNFNFSKIINQPQKIFALYFAEYFIFLRSVF